MVEIGTVNEIVGFANDNSRLNVEAEFSPAMPDQQQTRVFYGKFTHSVDRGRRVMVPFRWRTDLKETFLVLAWPLHQSECLKVLPPERAEKLFKNCGNEALSDEEAEHFNRALGCSSDSVELDENGRLLLLEDLTAAVGITNEVTLVGCRTYFEVWAPDRLEEALKETMALAATTAKDRGI